MPPFRVSAVCVLLLSIFSRCRYECQHRSDYEQRQTSRNLEIVGEFTEAPFRDDDRCRRVEKIRAISSYATHGSENNSGYDDKDSHEFLSEDLD